MYVGLVYGNGLEGDLNRAVLDGDALEYLFDQWNAEIQSGIKRPVVFAKDGGNGYCALLHRDDGAGNEQNENENQI